MNALVLLGCGLPDSSDQRCVYLKKHYAYVIRGVLASTCSVKGPWELARMGGVHLQFVAPVRGGEFLFLPALASALSAQYPRYLYKVNKRYRTRYLAGATLALRGSAAFSFLALLTHLVLFNAVNFRGLFVSEQPNPTTTMLIDRTSFYHGAQRAFDNDLLGIHDPTLRFVVQLALRGAGEGAFILRGLLLPVYYKEDFAP